MDQITIRRADDFHVHLRQGEQLPAFVREAARQFARVLVMPNLLPPCSDPAGVAAYRRAIDAAGTGLEALMTFKILPRHRPEDLPALQAEGAVAGKVYPEGATTNSEDGVRDIRALWPLFAAMQDLGLVLCLHGEDPAAFSLDREAVFLDSLRAIASDFPRLRVVLEHVTSAQGVEAVKSLGPQVGATITLHHLELTLDDVVGGFLNPHNFCKPIAKRPEDRAALLAAAISRDPKFFFGSDSAPHARGKKECAAGCAGVYSMPLALEGLADVFDRAEALDRLEDFVAGFGADFYGLPRNAGTVTLVRRSWKVPTETDGVVPYRAGRTVGWSRAE